MVIAWRPLHGAQPTIPSTSVPAGVIGSAGPGTFVSTPTAFPAKHRLIAKPSGAGLRATAYGGPKVGTGS